MYIYNRHTHIYIYIESIKLHSWSWAFSGLKNFLPSWGWIRYKLIVQSSTAESAFSRFQANSLWESQPEALSASGRALFAAANCFSCSDILPSKWLDFWGTQGAAQCPGFFFVHLQRRATLDMLRSDRCVKTVALVVEDPLRPLLAWFWQLHWGKVFFFGILRLHEVSWGYCHWKLHQQSSSSKLLHHFGRRKTST